MIDIQEAKLLMGGRAGVFGILSDIFENGANYDNIDNLCKYMDDLLSCLEFTGGDDDMVSGYEKLSAWFEIAKGLDKQWVEAKLSQEFAILFSAGEDRINPVFTDSDNIRSIYSGQNYNVESSMGSIGSMLDFIAELSQRATSADDMTAIAKSVLVQKDFLDKFIMPYISPFCEAVYNKSPDYGVFQHIAVILHGFIFLDNAVLNAMVKEG